MTGTAFQRPPQQLLFERLMSLSSHLHRAPGEWRRMLTHKALLPGISFKPLILTETSSAGEAARRLMVSGKLESQAGLRVDGSRSYSASSLRPRF